MTLVKQERENPTIDDFTSQCSPSGEKLLVQSVKLALRLDHHGLGISAVATALFWEGTIIETLQEIHIDSSLALKSFLERVLSGQSEDKPDNSLMQDIFSVARKESMESGASKVRAGDILIAIYNSPTLTGKALREALSPGREKGVSFLTQLRSAVDQVEKPWTT